MSASAKGLGRTLSVALEGIDGQVMEVEAALYPGLPAVGIIGLPDASVAEARERVRSAILALGFTWPAMKVVINLRPAMLRKVGSNFDVAAAIAVLSAAGRLPSAAAARRVHLGEFGLDGRVHGVRGVLPAVAAAMASGHREIVVPAANEAEAKLVPGARIIAVRHLGELARLYGALGARIEAVPALTSVPQQETTQSVKPDLADVIGQEQARRALEIAAAGGHHLFLTGPPGAGKTMLAARLPTILPDLDDDAAIEVTTIQSVAGTYKPDGGLVRRPPFEAPHHTATDAAIIGGGSGVPRPGAAVRAHHGVLFLDEAAEFSPHVLNTLRQPLEQGRITLQRARYVAQYPCQFQLVLATNPCPCGKGGGKGVGCTCSAQQLRRYQARLSGPLLDRVDLQVAASSITASQLAGGARGESSQTVAARVFEARARQAHRWADCPWQLNGRADGGWLREYTAKHSPEVASVLQHALDTASFSMRGIDRALRVAWTLCDLRGGQAPTTSDIGEALALRNQVRHG